MAAKKKAAKTKAKAKKKVVAKKSVTKKETTAKKKVVSKKTPAKKAAAITVARDIILQAFSKLLVSVTPSASEWYKYLKTIDSARRSE